MSDFVAQIRATLDTKQAQSDFNSFKSKIESEIINLKVKFDGTGNNSSFDTYLNNIQKQAQTAGKGIGTSLQQGIKSVKFNGNLDDFTKSQVDMMNRVKKNTQKISKDVESTLNNATSKEAERAATQIAKRYETQMNNAEKQISAMNKKFQDNQNRLSKLQSDTGTDKYKDTYKNTSGYQVIEENLKRIKTLQDQINSESTKTNPNTDKINADLKEMTSLLSKSENAFNNLTKPIGALDASIASNKTLSWLKENSKAVKELGSAFEELAQRQLKATTAGELENYNKEFTDLVNNAKSKGLTGKSWFDEGKRALTQIAQFTGMYGILQNVMQDLPRELVKNVADVDDAMTNLRMATSVSNTEAQNLMKTYSEMGRELKVLGTDVATSSTEWLKQGKSIQEADALTRNSIILSKIGDLSSEEATKTITAAMKSYDLNINEVMGFVDQISAIDMASATDVGGLSQAFNEVAANAKQAGIETKQLLSYAAVIGETTQEGMSSVGTSLNAIISRMGNIKLSRLKDFETGEDLSNVETVLKKVGISLRDSSGQFREFDDVLDDTASKWENFDSVTQRAVANAFAGTHHANNFMILMQQYDQAREYMQIADQSSGESIQKFTAYQESLAGAVEGFKNSVQGLSTSVVSGDFLTGIVDTGTGALDVITKLTDQFGTLGMIASGIGIFQGFTNGGKSIYGIRPYTFFKMTYAT